jgi:hypothetical protein
MCEGVHTEHCCVIHGCKYRDEDCTVVTYQKRQSFLCEDCSWTLGEFEDMKEAHNRIIELKTLLDCVRAGSPHSWLKAN